MYKNDYLNVLIIPTNDCNLRCEYCFHNEHILSDTNDKMSYKTLEHIFKIIEPYYKSVQFIWHGGEPLCMGLDFYKKVVEYEGKYNKNNAAIRNSVQTNMTLMSEEIAYFFKENGFKISSSYDGICNEALRHNSKSFWNKKKKCDEILGKSSVICVVSQKNIEFLIESYEFFKSKGQSFTINPYNKALNEKDRRLDLEISGLEYSNGVTRLYDYWMKDKNLNIRIGFFHEISEYILFGRKTKCNLNSCLGKWICIRPDGRITPCNRYFPEIYDYGNVNTINCIDEVFDSSGFELLLSQAIQRRNKCKECEIYNYCAGGCNNVALLYGGIENNNNEICIGNIQIYKHVNQRLMEAVSMDNISMLNPYLIKIITKYKEMNK